MNGKRFIQVTMLWLAGAGMVAKANWEEVRLKGRSYVTVASFAEFYRLSRPSRDGEYLVMSSADRSVRLRLNSRESSINGRRSWLSFACVTDDSGRALLSRADVIFLFDPVLRQGAGVPARAVKGVVIDPGHGGQDRGAQTRSGYAEKTAVLDTSLRLEKLLKSRGVPVVMLRRSDVFIPLEERARAASRYAGFIFVSMHYNSGPRQSHGVETYSLSPQGTPSTSSKGRLSPSDFESHPGNRYNLHNVLLADLIHREMAKMHSPAGDRGTKRARFVVLRQVELPAVLVEGGFMSHRVDGALIETAEYRQKVAAAVARGIEAYVRQVEPNNEWLGKGAEAEAPAAAQHAPARAAKPEPRPSIPPTRKPEDKAAPASETAPPAPPATDAPSPAPPAPPPADPPASSAPATPAPDGAPAPAPSPAPESPAEPPSPSSDSAPAPAPEPAT